MALGSVTIKQKGGLDTLKQVTYLLNLDDLYIEQPYYLHNQSTQNAICGIMERIYFVKDKTTPDFPYKICPRPLPKAFRKGLQPAFNKLRRFLPSTTPWTHAQFVESYAGQGRKQKRYQLAVEEMQYLPKVTSYHAELKSFNKKDKTDGLVPDPYNRKRAPPRMIQPRSPIFNVAVGCYIRCIEKLVIKAVNKLFKEQTNVVLKGYNAAETATRITEKWNRFKSPVFIGLDASRFDQHVSVDALKWEHAVYLLCFQGADRTELARLLAFQLSNKGSMYLETSTIKYFIRGNRMSGDMNTGLGNILLMASMCWQFAKDIKLDNFEYINNGDDCGFIVEKEDVHKVLGSIDTWFDVFGFEMTVEGLFYDLYSIVFCQCSIVDTIKGPVMVRKFPQSLYKDLISVKPLKNPTAYDKHRLSLSDCGLSLTDGVPIYAAFYRMLGRNAGTKRDTDVDLTGMHFMAKDMANDTSNITPTARYTFWLAFGITPDEQIAMEEMLNTITPSFAGETPVDIY